MRFAIVFSEVARHDLLRLPAHVRAHVLDTVELQLRHEPLRATRNRKPLRAPLVPSWELRIGAHRVIYRVSEEMVQVLRIVRKGRRKTEHVT